MAPCFTIQDTVDLMILYSVLFLIIYQCQIWGSNRFISECFICLMVMNVSFIRYSNKLGVNCSRDVHFCHIYSERTCYTFIDLSMTDFSNILFGQFHEFQVFFFFSQGLQQSVQIRTMVLKFYLQKIKSALISIMQCMEVSYIAVHGLVIA